MKKLKFKVGDVLVHTEFRGVAPKITVLEVNPSDKINAYRISNEPDYWWHKDTVETLYKLSEETVEPEHKFKVGDVVGRSNNDHFRRLIRKIDSEGYYWVSRYNADMLHPEDDTFGLNPKYVHRSYQLVGQTNELETEFNILVENTRIARKRVNKAKLEYIKHQNAYELAMEEFDKAQLAVNQYVQSKINDGLED